MEPPRTPAALSPRDSVSSSSSSSSPAAGGAPGEAAASPPSFRSGGRGKDRPRAGPLRCRRRRRPPGPGGGPEGPEPPGSRGGDGVRAGGRGPATEGDRLFARKCQELQGFIQPLTDLLNGLKMGRYEKGLSSFQQSVAMDRIQRIVGVLRKPEMGERYLGTLLQVEVMLKVWFPHVAPRNRRRPAKAAGGPREKPPAAQTPAPRPDRSRLPGTDEEEEEEEEDGEDEGSRWARRAGPSPEGSPLRLTWVHAAPLCDPPGPPAPRAFGIILFLRDAPRPLPRSAPASPAPPAEPPGPGTRCHSLPGRPPSPPGPAPCQTPARFSPWLPSPPPPPAPGSLHPEG